MNLYCHCCGEPIKDKSFAIVANGADAHKDAVSRVFIMKVEHVRRLNDVRNEVVERGPDKEWVYVSSR